MEETTVFTGLLKTAVLTENSLGLKGWGRGVEQRSMEPGALPPSQTIKTLAVSLGICKGSFSMKRSN